MPLEQKAPSIGGTVTFDDLLPHCEWQRAEGDRRARYEHRCERVGMARQYAMNALTAEMLIVMCGDPEALPKVKAALTIAVQRLREGA